jgi:metal-responsive CopG/Arc/MetJ family transcriptional regulator
MLCIRINEAGLTWIDEYAKTEGVNRSEMVRRMLTFAVKEAQKGRKL